MGIAILRLAMRRPISMIIVVIAIALCSVMALMRMKVDIFPELNLPVIYVVQPYGGMDPAQMEGFIVSQFEQHYLYITGVDHIESKTIQSASVMKITFQPSMNMADAMAQVIAQVERARAYMPEGTVNPFVLRYDAGDVPVGYLVFDSPTHTIGEVQDLAYVRIRPRVSTIPGVSVPPPFGGNQRTIVIHVDPVKLLAAHLSPQDVVNVLVAGNNVQPSGIVRTGELQRMSRINSTVDDIQELLKLPLKVGAGPSIYLGDIGRVEDTIDILTGYALVNSRPTVYMAISKLASASTLTVVDSVKAAIPEMQNLLPPDIHMRFVFDQSVFVTEAINGLGFEGGMGAFLTGIMVFLFLGDIKSSLIVIFNIPFALLTSVVCLWLCGQSINIMTLGGLALAVGILVDEATVAIENIHTHMARGSPVPIACYEACCEVVTPRLLAMLSVVSVFMPSFFMVGVAQGLFVPLSLAVGFSMFASYILSNTFAPILATWFLKPHDPHEDNTRKWWWPLIGWLYIDGRWFMDPVMESWQKAYRKLLAKLLRNALPVIAGYVAVVIAILVIVAPRLGREIFPAGNPSSFQLRLRAASGLRIESTLALTEKVFEIIKEEAGPGNTDITLAYVGTQPPSYAISNVYLFTSGPQEAVLLVALKESAHIQVSELKDRIRRQLALKFPDVRFSFEAGDIVNQIMNFGAPTPIQVDVNGPSFPDDQEYCMRILNQMRKIPYLRDVVVTQPLQYPTLQLTVDRQRAGQLGVTVHDVGRSFVSATYSSRFVTPVFWIDHASGMDYQVQVDIPQYKMTSIRDVENVPAMTGQRSGPYLRDVGTVSYGNMIGEYDHYNMKRQVSITANIAGDDLGKAADAVANAIAEAGKKPRGATAHIRGQVPLMQETFVGLGFGLILAVGVIVLMLVCYYQRVWLSFSVVSVVPSIIAGSTLFLFLTGTTINIQSFMGTIMAIGVGLANAILVVTFSEEPRMRGWSAVLATMNGAGGRLRPKLMTVFAMTAGMIPMALGLGEGGERNAPLGRAVIGGLLASTCAVLLVLPLIYALVQSRAKRDKPSLLPSDVYEDYHDKFREESD